MLGVGEFDVVDRPSAESSFGPGVGYRVNARTLAATCVHPFRVGLPAAGAVAAHPPHELLDVADAGDVAGQELLERGAHVQARGQTDGPGGERERGEQEPPRVREP